MTKKSTNIGKIIAGLTIILLGALVVYYLISFSSANNPDENQEVPEKKKKPSEKNNLQLPLQNQEGAPINETAELNAAWEEWHKSFYNGDLTLCLLFSGMLLRYIYQASRVMISPIDSKEMKNTFNKKWIAIILCLGFLTMLIEKWLETHVEIGAYVNISVFVATVLLGFIAVIMWVVLGVSKSGGGQTSNSIVETTSALEIWKENLNDGDLTLNLVFSGLCLRYIYQAIQVIIGKIDDQKIKTIFNKKWIGIILCLGFLGILSEICLEAYVDVRAYVFAIAYGISLVLPVMMIIMFVVLEGKKPLADPISSSTVENSSEGSRKKPIPPGDTDLGTDNGLG